MRKFKNYASLVTSVALVSLAVGLVATSASCKKKVVQEEFKQRFALGTGEASTTINPGETVNLQVASVKGLTESDLDLAFSVTDTDVLSVTEAGVVTGKQPGIATVIAVDEVSGVADSIEITVRGQGAMGQKTYSGEEWSTQAEILGQLEKYAQNTFLTGIPLCGDGSFVMYNPRVQKGVETYIDGYGFGILQYGDLTADLEGETVDAYKRYYHVFTSEDPHSFNDFNSNSSSVSDLSSYVRVGYFGSKLNDGKTDEEVYPVLSKDDDFEALDASADASPKAKKFRLHVKTGEDGVKYATNSQNSKFSKFNGRGVELEDYLTPFKIMLTKKFNLFRGSEMVGADYARPIKGAAEYWNASADGIDEQKFAELVGVKTGEDSNGGYIEFEFTKALTVSNAKTNLSGSLWQPLPMEFFEELGGDATLYGGYSENGDLTPVDTTLSLGAYTLEYVEKDKLITFKRNPEWIEKTEDTGMYNIQGVHMAVLTAAKSDTHAAFREFLANRLDVCSIPGDQLAEYQNDPRTVEIPESTTWKVNINATTPELWEELFGEQGSVAKTSRSNYWNIKPIMSNLNFLNGLYYSINRIEFSDSQNMSASQNYLSKEYYFTDDDDNKIFYWETEQHKDAIKDRNPDTLGYNLEAAKTFFQLAIHEEVDAGHYKLGTASAPTVIEVSGKWMTQSTLKRMGEPITQYMMDAFNSVDPRIQLNIKNEVAGADSDAMYEALENGQFDIGMGAIQGMQAYPLKFMQVLCSDNRSGFCLNWGPDTSVNDGRLFYDGNTWAFDTLWEAGDAATVAVNGETGFSVEAEISAPNVETAGDPAVPTGNVAYEVLYEAIAAQGVTYTLKDVQLEDYASNSGIGSGYAHLNLTTGQFAEVFFGTTAQLADEPLWSEEEVGTVEITVPAALDDNWIFSDNYAVYNATSYASKKTKAAIAAGDLDATDEAAVDAYYEAQYNDAISYYLPTFRANYGKYNNLWDVYFTFEIEYNGSKFTASYLVGDVLTIGGIDLA